MSWMMSWLTGLGSSALVLGLAAAQGTLSSPASRAWTVAEAVGTTRSGTIDQPDDDPDDPSGPDDPDLPNPPNPDDPGIPDTPEPPDDPAGEEPARNVAAVRLALEIGGADAFRGGGEVSAPIANPGAAPLADDNPDDGVDPNANRPALTTAAYRAAIRDGRIASAENRNPAGFNYHGLDRRDNLHRWPATAATAGELSLTWTATETLSERFVYRVFLTQELWLSGGELRWGDLEPLAEILPAATTRTGTAESFSVTLPERRARAVLVVIRQNFDDGDNRAFVAVADLDYRGAEAATRGVDARRGTDRREGGDNRGGAGPDGTPEDPGDDENPNNPGGSGGGGGDDDDPEDPEEEFSFEVSSDEGTGYSGVLTVTNNGPAAVVDPGVSFVIETGEVSTLADGVLTPSRGGQYRTQVIGSFAPGEEVTVNLSVTGVTPADPRGPSEAALTTIFGG